MKNCTTCANAIFDNVFGEYKCRISKKSIRAPLNVKCKDYKEGKPKESEKKYVE